MMVHKTAVERFGQVGADALMILDFKAPITYAFFFVVFSFFSFRS